MSYSLTVLQRRRHAPEGNLAPQPLNTLFVQLLNGRHQFATFSFGSVTEDRPQGLCSFKIIEYSAFRGPVELWSLMLMAGLRFPAFSSLLSTFVYLNSPALGEHLEIYFAFWFSGLIYQEDPIPNLKPFQRISVLSAEYIRTRS